jgi:DNA-directed RNA polymerase sigma subunit (sigma70/sigma32)
MTLDEIGVHEGVTRERIRQIEAKSIKKLVRLVRLTKREFDRPTQQPETTWERLEQEA